MTEDSIHSFVAQQIEWLTQELQSDDLDEDRSVRVLHKLLVNDISIGLYGRTVLHLTAGGTEPRLPAHKFTTGDEVELRLRSDTTGLAGVITLVTETSIAVALFAKNRNNNSSNNNNQQDEEEWEVGTIVSMIPKSSTEVHRKMVNALQELQREGVDHPVAGRVVRALFDRTSVHLVSSPNRVQLAFMNQGLDQSQQEAVQFALSDASPVALIHGPPGTGKTTTVVELILQAVNQQQRVLVAAPSNVAVDNVLAKLVTFQSMAKRVVRLGHPARLQANILPYSLEALVQSHDGTEIVQDVRRELEQFVKMIPKSKDRKAIYREMKTLRKEIRNREEKVVSELLHNARVVLATCVGAANKLLLDQTFDLVVIDEAAQALEAACWIPALQARRLVLAGDHCQLPPTIKSNNANVQKGLAKTLFERAMELYPHEEISRMLQVQYRMHKDIADWSSHALYNSKLQTHPSVGTRTLGQLTGQQDEYGNSETIMLLVDTAGCDFHESVNAAGSRYNEGEADIVNQHTRALLDLGVKQEDIAIITPYNGQVEILKSLLFPNFPKIEIRSVDGFQGGEREAVILSLVRSSERGGIAGIGFLKDERRLNVAVTRAKRHVCVICDSSTVSQSPFVENLVSWMMNHGETRSALEYIDSQEQIENDLFQAEVEINRLREENTSKAISTPKPRSEIDRKQLEIRIRNFVKSAKPGEKLPLSTELTSSDRKTAHEIAEELEIHHESQGTHGIDRRIILSIPKQENGRAAQSLDPPNSSLTAEISQQSSAEDYCDESQSVDSASTKNCDCRDQSGSSSKFSALAGGDNDDTGEEEDISPSVAQQLVNPSTAELHASHGMNQFLGSLAQERATRDSAARQSLPQSLVTNSDTRKNKKSKGHRLGGAKKLETKTDETLENLDDISFLDAQIEKVQSAHGRKIEGRGSNYRTIVNGVLNSTPKLESKKKDAKATAVLQAKIKQAQESRKAKGGKKEG